MILYIYQIRKRSRNIVSLLVATVLFQVSVTERLAILMKASKRSRHKERLQFHSLSGTNFALVWIREPSHLQESHCKTISLVNWLENLHE